MVGPWQSQINVPGAEDDHFLSRFYLLIKNVVGVEYIALVNPRCLRDYVGFTHGGDYGIGLYLLDEVNINAFSEFESDAEGL